jgi:hypothetical protein
MAATKNVIANMNIQIPDTISPVRMFLRASRRVIMGGGAFYRWASATIVQNSSAR